MANEKKERTSRRQFVREVAGAAVTGACVLAPCIGGVLGYCGQTVSGTAPSGAVEGAGERLVAPCGLYCGACPMYLASQEKDEQKFNALLQQFSAGKMQLKREDLLCDGCIANGRVASFCRRCEIRSCASGKSGVTRCSDCSDFPCDRITKFNNDGMLHHAEVLRNLGGIREKGITAWSRLEEERWRCPQCRTALSWYDKACQKCGAKRSDRLFPLKQA